MAIVKAILREPIKSVGKVGEVVQLKRGFFRYLENLGKVCYASKEAISRLEHEREELDRLNEHKREQAEKLATQLVNFSLELTREAGENGILYGSVSTRDLTKELYAHQIEVHHNQVMLSSTLKEVGTYTFALELHPQVIIEIPLHIRSQAKS